MRLCLLDRSWCVFLTVGNQKGVTELALMRYGRTARALGCRAHLPWLAGGRRLPVGRDRRQCGRPNRRGARAEGTLKSVLVPLVSRVDSFDRPQPLQHDRFVIPKSRYDSVDCYIADTPFNRPEYNDNDMPIDPKIRDHLIERGVDPILATHFAHLFIRDPIVIFEETMCQDDTKSSDHFEVGLSASALGDANC